MWQTVGINPHLDLSRFALMRYLRYFLTVLLIVAVMMLLVITGLFLYVTPERTGARLNALLASTAGVQLSAPIPVSLKHLPKLVVTLPPGMITRLADNKEIGRYNRLIVTLNPFAIFAEVPRIARIEADGIELDITATDLLRQHFVKPNFVNEPLNTTTTVDASIATTDIPDEPLTTNKAEIPLPTFWTIDEVELRDAAINLKALGKTIALTGTRLLLTRFSENGASLQLAAVVASKHLSGDLFVATVLDHSSQDSPQANTLEASFKGFASDQKVDARLSADRLSLLDSQIESTGITLDLQAGTASVHATVPSIQYSKKLTARSVVATSNFSFGPSKLLLDMSGNISYDFAKRETAATELRIDSLLSTFSPETTTAKHTALANKSAVSDRLTGDIRFSGTDNIGSIVLRGSFLGAPLTFNGVMQTTSASRPLIEGTLHTSPFESDAFDLLLSNASWLNWFDFRGNLIYSTISPKQEAPINAAASLTADMMIQDGRLSISSQNASCFGGMINFNWETTVKGDWSGSISLTNVDANSFARMFALPTVLSGELSSNIKASGQFTSSRSEPYFIDQLEGQAEVHKGSLIGFDLNKAKQILIEDRPETTPPEVIKADASTSFEALKLSFCGSRPAGSASLSGETHGNGWYATFSGNEENVVFHFDILADGKRPAVPMNATLQFNPAESSFVWVPDWSTALEHLDAEAPRSFSLINAFRSLKRSLRDFWEGLEPPSFTSKELPLPSLNQPKLELPEFLQNWRWPWKEDSEHESPPNTAFERTVL